MMNPFLLSPQDRLKHWRDFRDSLPSHTETEQLGQVAAYWGQAPLRSFAHDVERPDTWPTAWEMISEGEWCARSVGVGMEFTLRLAGWSPNRLRLLLVKDYDAADLLFVLEIDHQYYMNYAYGLVVPIPDTRQEIQFEWHHIDERVLKRCAR